MPASGEMNFNRAQIEDLPEMLELQRAA